MTTPTVSDILAAAANRDLKEVEARLYAFLDAQQHVRPVVSEQALDLVTAEVARNVHKTHRENEGRGVISEVELLGEFTGAIQQLNQAALDNDRETFTESLLWLATTAIHGLAQFPVKS